MREVSRLNARYTSLMILNLLVVTTFVLHALDGVKNDQNYSFFLGYFWGLYLKVAAEKSEDEREGK